MKFLFLDDSKVKKPRRQRMGCLTAVGGIIVDADKLRELEANLEAVCAKFDLPHTEAFKWSPPKKSFFRDNFSGEKRARFYFEIIDVCLKCQVTAVVSIRDMTKKPANKRATDAEIDALLLTMERFHTSLRDDTGFVVISKPSGGQREEGKMLAECVEHKTTGTDFVKFSKLAQSPVIMPSAFSRALQVADLFVSTACNVVAGNTEYSQVVFDRISQMLIVDWRGLKGNTGLKVHPFLLYKNVYYWVLGEECYANGSVGVPLPEASCPYYTDPLEYSKK